MVFESRLLITRYLVCRRKKRRCPFDPLILGPREIRTTPKQFLEFKTDEGDSNYMPASGNSDETPWDLPDGAEIISYYFFAVLRTL
jgi:hypothetical protein